MQAWAIFSLFLWFSLFSSSGEALCFERFYSQKHLKKHPKQVVKNILFDHEPVYETEDGHNVKVRLQIQMNQKGQRIVADAKAHCWADSQTYDREANCRIQSPGQGAFKYKGNGQWGFYDSTSVLITLDPSARFNDLTDAKNQSVQVPRYDHKMRVDRQEMVSTNDQSCEPVLFTAHTVSSGRLWNETILHSVRNDLARPTVTARNLFHLSALQWDIYAAYTQGRKAYFVQAAAPQASSEEAMDVAMSYAAMTFLKERYKLAPANTADNYPVDPDIVDEGEGADGEPDLLLTRLYDRMIKKLDYDKSLQTHMDFGKDMALKTLALHLNDGSRESENYAAETSYVLKNKGIVDVSQSGLHSPSQGNIEDLIAEYYDYAGTYTGESYPNTIFFNTDKYKGNSVADQTDINYWVRLNIPGSIDQGGTSVASEQSPLTLFWGKLPTFGNLSPYKSATKAGVYFDPGQALPSFEDDLEQLIQQNLQVIDYSALLSPIDLGGQDFDNDGTQDPSPGAQLIDISPAALGNNPLGTNDGQGRPLNPVTNKAYAANPVKAADYYRSIAEFWADGPESETPPGHWNTIANYVLDRMVELKTPFRWMGETNSLLDQDEYELRTYLTLNGALHDAAVVAWGIKGHYQGNRPISVLRKLAKMAEQDPEFAKKLVSYSPNLKMITYNKKTWNSDGSVKSETPVTKLAVRAWRGIDAGYFYPTEIEGPELRDLSFRFRNTLSVEEVEFYRGEGVAGVGWILADNWMPYQRQSFVTPPFPGFVSGHSTFSRAAAEVLTGVTGTEYFPGGLGTYPAPQLHFEYREMKPFDFHWATYFDASDVSGVSRIYGGIHASYDDLPARKIGSQVGQEAVKAAKTFFETQSQD